VGYSRSSGDPYPKASADGESGAALMHSLGLCVPWTHLHWLEELLVWWLWEQGTFLLSG